ncbi:MAG: tetratricopeptide repeat protein [Magnetospirillum sp.]|nr:tetratricopeptide repeat protein [Magnetospirillum sp.]
MADEFAKAVALHQAGRLTDAIEIYQRILGLDPYHEGANHLLGVACSQMGQFDLAVHLIGEAIRANGRVPDYHVNLGNALLSARRLTEAEASYRRALELNPAIPEALFGLGNALAQSGQLDEALAALEQAVAHRPAFVEALANMAGVLMRLGRPDEAVKHLRRAVSERPGEASLHSDLARALLAMDRPTEADAAIAGALRLAPNNAATLVAASDIVEVRGRHEEALEHAARAAELAPNYPPAVLALARRYRARSQDAAAVKTYLRLAGIDGSGIGHLFEAGNALADMRHHHEAVALYQLLLSRQRDHSEVWNNLGNSLRELGELDRAAECYETAGQLSPNDPLVLANSAALLRDMGRLDEALARGREAVAVQPSAAALSNLGQTLYTLGRVAEALDYFDAAGRAEPGNADVAFHRGIARLMLGDYREGWHLYEARWGCRRGQEARRHADKPQWRGEDIAGRTLLLWSEQGFGDTLQFVRYAPMAAARGARVVLEVQPALVSLFQGMEGVDKVVAAGAGGEACDVQAPLMSLPLAFATELDSIPATIPYLHAPAERLAPWRDRLSAALPEGKRVGLVWAGESREHDIECLLIDRRRSLALAQLAPILEVAGASFVSLQVGRHGAQALAFPALADLTAAITDFADTAALIQGLDLVICVDTSVAHLAAAMGKPVWLLSRFDGCWRWLKDRDDSPWYPNVRLYRQPEPSDWDTPIARIAADLKAFTASR